MKLEKYLQLKRAKKRSLKRSGWEISYEDEENLRNGKPVGLITYNRVGTPKKLVLQRADIKK